MPEGSKSNETTPTSSPELDKLAAKIGDVAGNFTEEQAAALNNPVMQAKLEQWRDAGHLNNGVFIGELAKIAQAKVEVSRTPEQVTSTEVAEKTPLLMRLKKIGAKSVAVVGLGLVGVGAGAALANNVTLDDQDRSREYSLANVDGHELEQGATEAEMAKFFDLSPSTHEFPDTRPYSFAPKSEVIYNYDGSEAHTQAVLDTFSDMFRRDVRIQAAWGSVLKVGEAPRVPSMTEMQDPGVYATYHKQLYEYTDRLAKDIKLRTADYNESMDSLKRADYGESKIADMTHASEQHDGKRVTIRMNMDNDSQYLPFQTTNAKNEQVITGVKGGCIQPIWITGTTATLPPVEVIDRPVAPPPPPPSEVAPPPPVTETPPPPRTPEPPRWTPPRYTPPQTVPKPPRDIPPAPAPIQGNAPAAVFQPPPPPPPPRYTAPAFKLPDFSNILPAPGARTSTGIWERGQSGSGGSSPSIPRNTNVSPGGGSGFNSGMTSE